MFRKVQPNSNPITCEKKVASNTLRDGPCSNTTKVLIDKTEATGRIRDQRSTAKGAEDLGTIRIRIDEDIRRMVFRVATRSERSEEREGWACRFAANPKISMLAGMLKPGISFGRLPEERYSVGGHARPEATGLVASNVRPLGLLAKKGEGKKKVRRRKNNEKTHRLCLVYRGTT